MRKNNQQKNWERGFTLLEVVFAVGILAIGIMGYTALKVSNRFSWVFSRELSQAVNLTGSQLEDLLRHGYYSSRMQVDDTGVGTYAFTPVDYSAEFGENLIGGQYAGTVSPPGSSGVISGEFIPSEVSWTVIDECPSIRAKMVVYTTKWGGGSRSMNITQVQVR